MAANEAVLSSLWLIQNSVTLRLFLIYDISEAEPDAARRRDLVAQTWTDDGTYLDGARDRRGHDEISAAIGKAQDHFPGYRLHVASGIDMHHNYLRFSWVAGGAPEAPLYIGGTDFASVAGDGGLRSVVGFTDAAPAPPPR